MDARFPFASFTPNYGVVAALPYIEIAPTTHTALDYLCRFVFVALSEMECFIIYLAVEFGMLCLLFRYEFSRPVFRPAFIFLFSEWHKTANKVAALNWRGRIQFVRLGFQFGLVSFG